MWTRCARFIEVYVGYTVNATGGIAIQNYCQEDMNRLSPTDLFRILHVVEQLAYAWISITSSIPPIVCQGSSCPPGPERPIRRYTSFSPLQTTSGTLYVAWTISSINPEIKPGDLLISVRRAPQSAKMTGLKRKRSWAKLNEWFELDGIGLLTTSRFEIHFQFYLLIVILSFLSAR